MKINFDKEKSSRALADIAQNTVALGKKVASSAKSNVIAAVEKSHNDSYERRLKKYNPLFEDRFKSETFNLPNIIRIVDDAVRRGIDVCEGAIGWLDKENGIEVLYLYDEAVTMTNIQFIPSANCDAVYCVDAFDRHRFIRSDYIFGKAHEERMAELEHIAYCLGAKRCTIDISESDADSSQQAKSAKINSALKCAPFSGSVSGSSSVARTGTNQRKGHIELEFQGSDQPTMPTLKWFAHDDIIKQLIKTRCESINAIKIKTLHLSGASSATMSQKIACAIDGVVGKSGKIGMQSSMHAQAEKEHQSTLHFYVEF